MNKFLLDTNVLLWYFWDTKRIKTIKKFIESSESEIFISPVSWWEIAIKIRAGKIKVDLNELLKYSDKHYFEELPINKNYMKAYLELPDFHKDPFDLMLLAQAITCPMRLITGDSILAEYSSLVMVI